MTKIISLTILSSLFALSAWAGDNGGGTITCKSGSGRTQLKGGAGVYSGRALFDFTIDGKTVTLGADKSIAKNAISSSDAVVFDEKLKVYTLKVVEQIQYEDYTYAWDTFELIASPSTFKKISGSRQYEMTAVISKAIDPRQDQSKGLVMTEKPIEVRCLLDLSI